MSKISGCFVLLLAAALCGCALDHQLVLKGPTQELLQGSPTFEELITRYRAGRGEEARQARNQILRRLMLADDEYFLTYTNQLYHGRALADASSEIVNASLTTAATAINPAAAAKVLTGIAAGLAASKISVDKNLFMQQASSALIAKMEAQREEVDVRIQTYLKQSVDDYPLEEGLRDFIKYYRAGTLAAASQSLTADAEQQHGEATADLHTTKLAVSPLTRFTTPGTNVTVIRRVGAGTVREGADTAPMIPAQFRARNKRLRDAFENLGPDDAKAALVKAKVALPPKTDPLEFLAQQILARASLDSHWHGGTALASLTHYRLHAVDDKTLGVLENAYSGFLVLPTLPVTAHVTAGGDVNPPPTPSPTP